MTWYLSETPPAATNTFLEPIGLDAEGPENGNFLIDVDWNASRPRDQSSLSLEASCITLLDGILNYQHDGELYSIRKLARTAGLVYETTRELLTLEIWRSITYTQLLEKREFTPQKGDGSLTTWSLLGSEYMSAVKALKYRPNAETGELELQVNRSRFDYLRNYGRQNGYSVRWIPDPEPAPAWSKTSPGHVFVARLSDGDRKALARHALGATDNFPRRWY